MATAKALKQKGFDCTVYDRNPQLGGVWSDGYTGWGVQVQKDLYQFPDYPLPDDAPDFYNAALRVTTSNSVRRSSGQRALPSP